MRPDGESFLCMGCMMSYPSGDGFADFVDVKSAGLVAERALVTWGENLHRQSPGDGHGGHYGQFRDAFGSNFDFAEGGAVLDIGCGAGEDVEHLASLRKDLNVHALDIGENVRALAARNHRSNKNLRFYRADARSLPFQESQFDHLVSFGVFHHTDNPQQCVREAFRVLKPGGTAFVYLYKNHEDNPGKRIGVAAESFLMNMLGKMPHQKAQAVCHALAIPCLLLFSWPAGLMKKIPATAKIANSMPMHWGTTPASIYPDLEDRLLAPVNHRYSRKGFSRLFEHAGFVDVQVVTGPGGHYAMAKRP